MNNLVKLYARPKLNAPVMVAAWPGIGDVSVIVASYLQRSLSFKDLGEIEPTHFFDPIGVIARDGLVEEPQFPRSRFYYWKNKAGSSDIILFMGDSQPGAKGYELAHTVLDVAEKFQVTRVYTCAAALSRIHHTEEPKAWGVATSQEVYNDLKKNDLVQSGNLQIAGWNGLLLGVAKEGNIEGVCMLGEVPTYATRIQNPMAAVAILAALTRILGIQVDMTELKEIAAEMKERVKQMAAEAMSEYIDYFPEPIWEQGEEGEEDDEEEE